MWGNYEGLKELLLFLKYFLAMKLIVPLFIEIKIPNPINIVGT